MSSSFLDTFFIVKTAFLSAFSSSLQKLDLVELLYQTGGEFNERFESRNLTIVTKIPSEQIFIYADGRQLYSRGNL